jgi:hypothetical protein
MALAGVLRTFRAPAPLILGAEWLLSSPLDRLKWGERRH